MNKPRHYRWLTRSRRLPMWLHREICRAAHATLGFDDVGKFEFCLRCDWTELEEER